MIRFLIAPVLAASVALAAMPAMAAKIPLADISAYLNNLSTAKAEFTQVNADGTISTGTLYIKRPGRVRFEYNPPEKSLVIAGSGSVAIFDGKSNDTAEQYPLVRTPLSIILARNVDLGRAKMVVSHTEDGNTTKVRAQDPEHPEYGSIDLIFTANPVELRQWVVNDDAGSGTTVILGEMAKGAALNNALFDIDAEQARRRR